MKTHTWMTPICCIVAAITLTLCASAADIVDSGKCGDNLTYTLDSDGVLTISGVGTMEDWEYRGSPWYEKRDSIVTAVITNGVTSIGKYAFRECASLTSVTIPDSVTSIGIGAFQDCANLKSVTIPDSVTSIGNAAFWGCRGLRSVTIPDSVTSIGQTVFLSCSGLMSVTISNSVTAISVQMFAHCSFLTSVTIPNSVTSINWGAFEGCGRLTNVYYSGSPAQWSEIQISDMFNGNDALKKATIHCSAEDTGSETTPTDKKGEIVDSGTCGDNLTWTLDSNGALNISGTGAMDDPEYYFGSPWYVWYGNNSSIVTVVINDGVTHIGNFAFWCCDCLTSVTIPDSVTSIAKWAFGGCKSLTSVTIPDSVTAIGSSAFRECASLTSVTIPDGVTVINAQTFSDCTSLKSITIPISVTSIDWYTFSSCKNLTDVYYSGSTTQWSEIRIFNDGNDALENAIIHYSAEDVGLGVTLTDENNKIVDGNGQTVEGEGENAEKKDVFQDGAEFTASFAAADPDAVTSSELVTANVFLIFYDRDGLMVSLESKEIDLSDPFNLMFVLELRIPEGAKTLKFLILSDSFEPLRAARMIESSAA